MSAIVHEQQAGLVSGERDVVLQNERVHIAAVLTHELRTTDPSAQLEVHEASGYGAEDSGHDVFFLRSAQTNETVAVKRFRREEAARFEADMMGRVAERGFTIFTLAGKGVVAAGEAGTILATHLMPNLVTMNQIPWGSAVPGAEGYDKLANVAQSIAEGTASMHAAGIAHGDWQIKNIAQVPSGENVLHDLENVNLTDDPRNHTFEGYCIADLTKMTKSLVAAGFLAGTSSKVFREELTNLIFEPYWLQNPSELVMDGWDALLDEIEQDRVRLLKERAVGGAVGVVAIN
jgi:hypothetical protein